MKSELSFVCTRNKNENISIVIKLFKLAIF